MIDKSVIGLASIIAVIPHLGFPNSWEEIIISVLAVFIILLVILKFRKNEKTNSQI
jgi:predicted ABC-type exoprotein transport system permease subunit